MNIYVILLRILVIVIGFICVIMFYSSCRKKVDRTSRTLGELVIKSEPNEAVVYAREVSKDIYTSRINIEIVLQQLQGDAEPKVIYTSLNHTIEDIPSELHY